MFKIIFDKKNDFKIFRGDTPILYSIDTRKLFHGDEFNLDSEKNVEITKSKVRNTPSLCGILLLNGTTTFGRHKKRCYYLCRSYQKELPSFLIPYKPPTGFVKSRTNLFVRFRYESWTGRLPTGTLLETLGTITDYHAFCRYQLHCHGLWQKPPPITTSLTLNDRVPVRHSFVFTIDPQDCRDFDDAFSVTEDYISVYIANVPLVLENIKYWKWEQTASIYCTTHTRNMLPHAISEDICSLRNDHQNKTCVVLDINRKTGQMEFSLCQCIITRNFTYQEDDLLKLSDYQTLWDFAKIQNNMIQDSHDVVSFYMMLFNKYAAQSVPDIVYRATIDSEKHVAYFPYRGTYTCSKSTHAALDDGYYGHFTSPIRRVVDIVNLIQLQKHFRLHTFDDHTEDFLKEWQGKIDFLNDQTRQIRKIENQCKALALFTGTTMQLPCQATVLEQVGPNRFEMFVHDYRLILKMKSEDILLLDEKYDCVLYLLEQETTYMKKIRLKRL